MHALWTRQRDFSVKPGNRDWYYWAPEIWRFKEKKSGFLRDSIVFGRLQIISSERILSDGVSPIETMKNEPVSIVVCGEV